ncbi:MAG TPA: class I SAM-dependent methyltransferase [Candidatus Saccharimonadales bacterium]|nr:class I SAM-dependent methyltransferase [Candidatus Saccharimonadales bacterium]
MQKSLYQDETFANYWNDRAGDAGEAYKRYVLDPLMFKLVGTLTDKTVLEMGCGNGYLAPKFLEQNVRQVIMMDISEYNLRHAAEKCSDPKVSFVQQDATERWNAPDESIDIVYSNMMLNEVEDSATPMREAVRVLRPGGAFVFSVTHPAWDLFIYAQEKATGMKSKKIVGLGGYFRRGFAKFIMGADSKTNPAIGEKYNQEFAVEHYQRPVSDYFSELVDAGFTVNQLVEPELTKEILENNPRFAEYADNPIGLVFYCTKP